MAGDIKDTQKTLFAQQEELRIEEARRRFKKQQEEKDLAAAQKQAKKEEEVFRFVKPRTSKANPVANISESEPLVVSTMGIEQDDMVTSVTSAFEPKSVFTVDNDDLVLYPDELQDSGNASDDLSVDEVVNTSCDDILAVDQDDDIAYILVEEDPKRAADLNDDDRLWIDEEDPKFTFVDANDDDDYTVALNLHLKDLEHSGSQLATDQKYIQALKDAYAASLEDPEANGGQLDVSELSADAQEEAHRQNLSLYTFFGSSAKYNMDTNEEENVFSLPVASLISVKA